jgi:hypothetical protein
MLKSKHLIYLHGLTLSFARSPMWGTPSSPGGSEAARRLQHAAGRRHQQQPDPPPNFSKLRGGSEATPSGCARAPPLSRRTPRPRPAGPRAPQPADSASAPGALDVTVGFFNNGKTLRATFPSCPEARRLLSGGRPPGMPKTANDASKHCQESAPWLAGIWLAGTWLAGIWLG